jgi:DNA-binding LytR/AlgR family response regulator
MTPRPIPERRLPLVAGGLLVALALPIFLVAEWRLDGWALGAVLWVASQLLGLVFTRIGIGEPTLRGSGIVAFGMMARGILLVLVAIAVATTDPELAIAGALVYAVAYTFELALSLTLYFAGGPRR